MKKVFSAGIALLFALAALPASAELPEMRPYFTVGYDYIYPDDDRASKKGDGYSFGAGKAINELWGIEFGGFFHQFDPKAGAAGKSWREYGGELSGLFFYSRGAGFSPYFTAGLGHAVTDLKSGAGGRSGDLFADAGLGFFKYFAATGGPDIGMRADVRYRWLDTNLPGVNAFGEPVVRVGLVLPLGARAVEAAGGAGAPVPGGISTGKPAPGDADGDGVMDDKDNCPGTVGGILVDKRGCPIDSDNDGVADNLDKCPGTARGLTVDAKGCPVSASEAGANRSFENTNFAFDKSELTDYAKATLDNAASVIGGLVKKYPGLKVDISGHTDWMGTDAYNQALSERRANSVKAYLVRKGVDANRISTFAYGESKPIAPNDTDEGRALNRRAEVRTHE